MRLKRPHVAPLDEVTITRNGDEAIIEYADQRIGTTHFRVGPEVQQMTDGDILDRWNACVRGMEQARAAYEHVAVEIPPGRPQIRYFERGDQWTPRGDVLRCEIDDGGPGGEPIIHIENRELCWRDFGRLLTTHAGWGRRIVFVPDDELDEKPRIEIREAEE
jgi:hypothetical protein